MRSRARPAGSFFSVLRTLAVILLLFSLAEPVQADPGCDGVSVAFEGAWDPALRAAVAAEIETALRARGLVSCPADEGASGQPQATLRLEATERSVRLGVQIGDDEASRTGREVDLASVPGDTRPLAVAIAADELLMASRSPAPEPEPLVEPEPEPEPSEEPDLAPPPRPEPAVATPRGPPVWLELAVSGSGSTRGSPHLGGGVGVRLPLHPRFELALIATVEGGLPRSGPLGSLESLRVDGGLQGAVALAGDSREGAALSLVGSAHLGWARLRSDAADGANGSAANLPWSAVRLGLGAGWVGRHLRVDLQLGGGVVVLGARAIDDTETLQAGSAGIEGWARLAMGLGP